MNIFSRLFWLPFNERIVDIAVIPSLGKTLRSFIKARGVSQVSLCDELLDELLLEAIERAEKQSSDGKARYRHLWIEMEKIADVVAQYGKNEDGGDLIVFSVMQKYSDL